MCRGPFPEHSRLFPVRCWYCESASRLGASGAELDKKLVDLDWRSGGVTLRFADGTTAVADEAYLRESIKEPAARVVRGFDRSDIGMPSYEGVLTDPQIEALVLYLKTVR